MRLSQACRAGLGLQPGPAAPPGPRVASAGTGTADGLGSWGHGATRSQRWPRRGPGLPVGLPSSRVSPPRGAETPTRHPLGQDEGAWARLPLAKVRVDRACCLHGEDGSHLVQGGDQDADLADAGCEQQGPRWLPVGFAVAKDLGARKGEGLGRAPQHRHHAALGKGPRHSPTEPDPPGTTQALPRAGAHPEPGPIRGMIPGLAGLAPTAGTAPFPADPAALPAPRAALVPLGPPPSKGAQLSLATASVESGTRCPGWTRCRWTAAPPAAAGTWRGSGHEEGGQGCVSGCIRGCGQREPARARAGAGRVKEGG